MVANFRSKNYQDKLKEAGMLNLEKRRERGDMIHMFRIMTGKDDVHYSTWFQKLSDMENGANTRAAAGYRNVKQPGINNEIRRNLFRQMEQSS